MIAMQRTSHSALKRVWRNTTAMLKESFEVAFPGLIHWPIFKPELARTIFAMIAGFLVGIPVGHALSHMPWPIGAIACPSAFAVGTGAFRYFVKVRPWNWLIDLGLGLWVLGLAMTLAWLATN